MGFILSKFRKKKSTLDILDGIEKEINRITACKNKNVASQNTLIKYILTYGVVFWLGALGLIYYLYRTAQRTDEYILLLPLVVVIPCLLFIFRRILSWWYHRKIIKDDSKLIKLKDEKAKMLDEVMEKETFKVATQILERFDPSKLSNKGNPGPGAPGARQLVGARPLGSGMDLRKRPPPQNMNSSLSSPANHQRPVENLNQTIAAMPASAGGSSAPLPLQGGRGGFPGRGPPLPRPVLPRERGYLDKFVEYLVGDGPANRYALICRQCQSHNGMALREEFEYISYRCCYCHYWNPARKQRPVAPKLPDPASLKQQDIDSSDESSKSEKNSAANSRRSSLGESEQETKSGEQKTGKPETEKQSAGENPNSASDESSAETKQNAADTKENAADMEEHAADTEHIELINQEDTVEEKRGGVVLERSMEGMEVDT